jgi:hypothetical protein
LSLLADGAGGWSASFKFIERFQDPEKGAGAWCPGERRSTIEHRESTSSMILRAAFFIGLVAFLMPREPDLGLGRPGASITLPSASSALAALGLSRLREDCSFCTGNSETPAAAYRGSGRNLSDVKAEIEAAIKARRAAR